MREIKFRIIHNGKTYYWGYIKGGFAGIPSAPSLPLELAKKLSCQYTGLKDKKGVEIYKGDIVKAREQNSISKKKYKQEVIFYYGCFILAMLPRKIRLRHISAPLIINDVEVIGNIYENPELLKGVN